MLEPVLPLAYEALNHPAPDVVRPELTLSDGASVTSADEALTRRQRAPHLPLTHSPVTYLISVP